MSNLIHSKNTPVFIYTMLVIFLFFFFLDDAFHVYTCSCTVRSIHDHMIYKAIGLTVSLICDKKLENRAKCTYKKSQKKVPRIVRLRCVPLNVVRFYWIKKKITTLVRVLLKRFFFWGKHKARPNRSYNSQSLLKSVFETPLNLINTEPGFVCICKFFFNRPKSS